MCGYIVYTAHRKRGHKREFRIQPECFFCFLLNCISAKKNGIIFIWCVLWLLLYFTTCIIILVNTIRYLCVWAWQTPEIAHLRYISLLGRSTCYATFVNTIICPEGGFPQMHKHIRPQRSYIIFVDTLHVYKRTPRWIYARNFSDWMFTCSHRMSGIMDNRSCAAPTAIDKSWFTCTTYYMETATMHMHEWVTVCFQGGRQ